MASGLHKFLEKTIQEKEKKIVKIFKQFMAEHNLVEEYLLVGLPKLRDHLSHTKLDKVKALMPFACQLTSKFQASKHRFQTDKLHRLGLTGAILVVAESYKGNIFGGFTPKMFPKT